MEANTNAKVLSDLNPGISVDDADVFEVSQQAFNATTWHLVVEANDTNTPVRFRVQVEQARSKQLEEPAAPQAASTSVQASSGSATQVPTAVPEKVDSAPLGAAQSSSGTAVQQIAPSFDCARAATQVERMICGSPALSKADLAMADFYRRNIAAAGSQADGIRAGQRMFIAQRNHCGSEECVAEAYRARYEELAQLGYIRE